MFINDLLLFCIMLLLHIILFLVTHWIILRRFIQDNIIYSFLMATFLSVTLISLLSYLFIASFFSSFSCYMISMIGTALTAIFAFGLYAFLGPITSDRSLACQLIILLNRFDARGESFDNIQRRFDQTNFIQKRIDECKMGGIVEEINGKFFLSKKGKKLAQIYIFLLGWLNIKNRNEYREYFYQDANLPPVR